MPARGAEKICAELFAHSQPARLPKGWRFLSSCEFVRVCDTSKLFEKLLLLFPTDELFAARLVAKLGDELKPDPVLMSRLFFRRDAEADCFDVRNQRGA